MDVQILGTLRVLDDGRELALGGPRQQLVLAVLVQRAGTEVATATLVDGVWGTSPPSTARKTAQVYVSRLRQQVGADHLGSSPGGYVLTVAADEIDARRFQRLAGRGRERLASDPSGARDLLEQALGLWRGMPWGELGDEPVLQPDVVRLSELRLVALEDRIAADLELGRARDIVGELEGLVAGRPLREGLRGHLMLALHQSGQSARALEVYEEGRRVLADELGADPSPYLQDLHAQVLRQDPRLQVAAATAMPRTRAEPATTNPYRGLEPFRRRDAGLFHGREDLVEVITARLADHRLVAVVGPSGSGKSSVVRAGVVPDLETGSPEWLVATMVPGADPFAALARALAGATAADAHALAQTVHGDVLDVLRLVLATRHAGRLLLVVDQFEELFLVADPDARERFVAGLAEVVDDPSSDVAVLLTLRADFLHRPLADPTLGGRLREGLVTVPPLTAAGVEQACTAPAGAVGVTVEPELVAELVAAVTHQPGGLPLFQYALTQLFDERAGTVLTKAALDGMGGMQGILARRAEDVHDGLDEPQRRLARQVFLRLVVLGEGAEDTRRRASRRELGRLPAGRQAVDLVLERFGRARLMTLDRDDATGEATVEVAHEALLQAWPRLRRWVDDARDDLRMHRALSLATADWEAAGRHADYLLTGARLAQYDDWEPTSQVATTGDEDRFIAASRAHRDDVERREAERRAHERALEERSVRRMRGLVGVLVVALVVGVGLTAAALSQRRTALVAQGEAQRRGDAAVLAGELARARELAATAVANQYEDPDLAVNLALHAVDIVATTGEPIPVDVTASLHWTVQAAGATYPVRDAPVAVLDSPEGPRGLFDVEPVVLFEMATEVTDRRLRPDECADHLGTSACPVIDTEELAAADWEPLPAPADAARPLAGTSVRMVSQAANEALTAPGIEAAMAATGIRIEVDFEVAFWDEARETGTIIERRIDIGNVPQPAAAVDLGTNGVLMDLSAWFPPRDLRRDLSDHLVSLVSTDPTTTAAESTDGHVWGLPFDVNNKSLIWFPIPEFAVAGYVVPHTWEELETLVEQIEANGGTPWCHYEEEGEFSGWPGTDWIEDILLQTEGVDTYDAWVAGEIPFSDPAIRRAFERFDRLVLAPGRVWRGRESAAQLHHVDADGGLLNKPPSCWLSHRPSFVFGEEDWGTSVDAFPVPPPADAEAQRVLVGGGYTVARSDRPEVRAAVAFISGPRWSEAQATGRSMSPHRDVDTSVYPAHVQPVAEALRAAVREGQGVRFDASDLMPQPVQEAFWAGMVDFVGNGPDNLDEVLASIDAAWDAVDEDAERD